MTSLEKFGLKILEEARKGISYSPNLVLKMWSAIDKGPKKGKATLCEDKNANSPTEEESLRDDLSESCGCKPKGDGPHHD